MCGVMLESRRFFGPSFIKNILKHQEDTKKIKPGSCKSFRSVHAHFQAHKGKAGKVTRPK